MDSAEQFASCCNDSVVKNINLFTQSWALNYADGGLEKSAPELPKNENNVQVSNVKSFFASYGLTIKVMW